MQASLLTCGTLWARCDAHHLPILRVRTAQLTHVCVHACLSHAVQLLLIKLVETDQEQGERLTCVTAAVAYKLIKEQAAAEAGLRVGQPLWDNCPLLTGRCVLPWRAAGEHQARVWSVSRWAGVRERSGRP